MNSMEPSLTRTTLSNRLYYCYYYYLINAFIGKHGASIKGAKLYKKSSILICTPMLCLTILCLLFVLSAPTLAFMSLMKIFMSFLNVLYMAV